MGDLISREALLEYIKQITAETEWLVSQYNADWIYTLIESAPPVDAAAVIRCKDCKRWLKDTAGCTDFVGRCAYANYMIGATGYCLYGERKEKGDGRT